MNKSLKQILMEELVDKKYISIERAHQIAKSNGHSESNAERRLRHSESPSVEALRNTKGYITGYRLVDTPPPPIEAKTQDTLFKLPEIKREINFID